MLLLYDFYQQGEVDPLVIIREYKTYWQFLQAMEKDSVCKLSSLEKNILEYLSKTLISGVRPGELFVLKELFTKDQIRAQDIKEKLMQQYGYVLSDSDIVETAKVLKGHFTINESERQKYQDVDLISLDKNMTISRLQSYGLCLNSVDFVIQVRDIINVGLARYKDKYLLGHSKESPFVLYEKYSRRDVSLLMNCGKDLSSVMYGKYRKDDDVFIFVTYHKAQADSDEQLYASGKPDYADSFVDNVIFKWDSQMGKGVDSSYMQDVTQAKRKHLLVKKSDAETGFYYMGTFDVIAVKADKKQDNKGRMQDIAKVTLKMHHPVREDLLTYLQSKAVD